MLEREPHISLGRATASIDRKRTLFVWPRRCAPVLDASLHSAPPAAGPAETAQPLAVPQAPAFTIGYMLHHPLQTLARLRHPWRFFCGYYRSDPVKHSPLFLISGGCSVILSSIAAHITQVQHTGGLTGSLLTCLTSTGTYYLFLVPQLLAVRDRRYLFNEQGRFSFKGLWSCMKRYATLAIINEPLYFVLRNGALFALFTYCTWLPRWTENVSLAALGIAASAWWLPWLNRRLERP